MFFRVKRAGSYQYLQIVQMPQPQGDHRDVHSRLEQVHGRAVSNAVGSYSWLWCNSA
jgi:hypothetical protein